MLARSTMFSCAVLMAVGCGSGEKLVPVAGKVFLEKEPIVGGPRCYVVFQPDRSKGNNSPTEPKSTIEADGTYKLASAQNPGAAPGWFRVRVDAAEVIDPNNPYVTKWLVPEKYIDFQRSGLAVEVVEKPAEGAYDLKLKK